MKKLVIKLLTRYAIRNIKDTPPSKQAAPSNVVLIISNILLRLPYFMFFRFSRWLTD